MQMYGQDYDEHFPILMDQQETGYYSLLWAGGQSWDHPAAQDLLYPYIKNAQLYKCPDDPAATFPWGQTPVPQQPSWGQPRSYGYNIDWYHDCGLGGGCADGKKGDSEPMSPIGKSEAAVPAPSTTIFMSERFIGVAGCNVIGTNWCSDTFAYPEPGGGGGGGVTSSAHTDGDNYLFCDGHVKRMKRSQTDTDTASGVRTPHDYISNYYAKYMPGGISDGLGMWDIRQQ